MEDLKYLSTFGEASRPSKAEGMLASLLEKAYAFVGQRSPSNASIPLAQRRLRGEEQGLGISRSEVDTLRSALRRYGTGLNEVVSALKRHIEHRRARGYDLARLGFYLQRLGELEEMFNDGHGVTLDWRWLKANGERLEGMSNQDQDLNQTLTNDILAGLQYQQGMVKQAEKLLSTHEKQFNVLQSSHEELARLQMRHAASRASGSARIEHETAQGISDIKAKIERTEQALRQLNGTIEKEIQRFNEQKRDQLREVMETLVETEQRRCKTQVETLLQFTNA